MILSSFPKLSVTVDGFSKRFNPAGVYNVYHAYRPAHYLDFSSLPWRTGWVGAVSTSPSLKTFQDHQWRQDTRSQHPAPRPLIFLTP